MSQDLNLQLTDGESTLLNSTAQRPGVTPQQLARTTIVDALNRMRNDDQFVDAVKAVLSKNAELSKRLAR